MTDKRRPLKTVALVRLSYQPNKAELEEPVTIPRRSHAR